MIDKNQYSDSNKFEIRFTLGFSSRILLTIFLCLSFSGCFDNADTSKKALSSVSTEPVSSITQFKGAVSAFNRVSGIEIKWEESAVEPSLYRVYKLAGRKLNLIATLASGTNGFIDGDVTWGATYSYIVRAVDLNGIEETNENAVTSLAWGGIAAVLPTSRSSIKVSFDFGTPLIDEVRIYLTSKVTGVKTKVATLSGSDLEANIENLRIGYSYKVSAQAYMNSLKKEDGNEVFFDVETETEGFHDEESSLAKWRNIINVRAFGESLGTVAHPVTPEKVPRTRVIEVAFNSFTSKDSLTKYAIVRARVDYPLDTSTQATCTEAKFSSCKVCETTGIGTLFCRDTFVAPAPTKYRYTMAIIQEDAVTGEKWVEPLPQDKLDNYSILVPVPPDNMTLVQRDAVNYEMCQGMNRVSDPANHNRCPYAGVGAAPYSSGHNKPPLNLPTNYYDYGYNLFVDRYPLACNWTTTAFGGKCGVGATDGDCLGTTIPSTTLGVEGNVYWVFDGITPSTSYKSLCYVKRDNAWMRFDSMLSSKANNQQYLQNIFTNDPGRQGGKRPVAPSFMGPNTGTEVCKSFGDPNYGAKRLPRLREYRAFTAFPTLSNEPYAMTYTKALSTRSNGNPHDSMNGYNCDQVVNDPYPTTQAQMMSPSNEIAAFDDNSAFPFGVKKYFQGALATADCQSRYGIQLNMASYNFVMNDYINFDSSNKRYTGAASPIDNGNRDLLTDLNGGQTGFRMDITNPVVSGTSTFFYLGSTSFVNYVILPLGLPVLQVSSSEYLPRNLFLERYSDVQYSYITSHPSAGKSIVVTSRWETNFRNDYSSNPGGILARCVLPAD